MTPTMTYLLSQHVYVCATGPQAVALDVKRDRYIGFTGADSEALAAVVKGWPSCDPKYTHLAGPPTCGAALEKLLSEMASQQLLTMDARRGKEAACTDVDRPTHVLHRELVRSIRPRDVRRFVVACASVAVRMRLMGLESALTSIRRAKSHVVSGHSDAELAEVIEIFDQLRPLAFTQRDHCLFDSFALAQFTTMYGLTVTVVIGVQTSPFAAHCWAQQGTLVLNDEPGHVLKYTPILVL